MSNKIVAVSAGTGQSYWVMGDLFTYLVTGEESGGSYFTLRVDAGPHKGPPPHIHHLEEEQFYVLEGDVTFQIGDRTIRATAGDFVHIPRDTVHSFMNGSSPAKFLATFAPAGIEEFFRRVGDPAEDRIDPPPQVTPATIARFLEVESNGWKEHHETLPPPAGR